MNKVFIDVDGETYQLPVPPPKISNILTAKNEKHSVVGIGEVSTLGGVSLKQFEFESFFPKENNYPFIATSNGFMKPSEYIDLFKKIAEGRKVCRFVITDTTINHRVSIEEFEEIYQYGTEDLHFRLVLLEYKEVSVKTLEPVKDWNDKTEQVEDKKDEVIEKPPDRPKEDFSIGDRVRATGRYFYTSLGAKPFGTFKPDFVGKISLIVLKNEFSYHITTESGGALGWVKKEQLSHA